MQTAFETARWISIVAFLGYGLACLFSDSMVEEFERFGLAGMRRLTGSLEVLGALGLIAGWFVPPLTVAASAGLSALMLLGVGARIRVGDPALSMVPALVLMALNAFVLFHSLRHGQAS